MPASPPTCHCLEQPGGIVARIAARADTFLLARVDDDVDAAVLEQRLQVGLQLRLVDAVDDLGLVLDVDALAAVGEGLLLRLGGGQRGEGQQQGREGCQQSGQAPRGPGAERRSGAGP